MCAQENIYGYVGKMLRVNLSNGDTYEEPTIKYAKDWLGVTGIAVKILYDELKPWVTPYDPLNKIIFGAGTLIGTPAPGANKLNISTLGPMMGGWASSCSDSYLGGEIKAAGYDLIIIEGRAHLPVYLYICDGKVEIRDACHLWGKDTWETHEAIREELGDNSLHTASIGPAGENLCRGACIINDKSRAHGRGGIGAVMGSKNLKALVAKGTGSVKVAEPERFMKAVAYSRNMFKGRKKIEMFHKYGTLGLMPRKQEVSGLIYKNFQDVTIPKEMEAKVDPRIMIDKYEVARQSYPGCALGGCSRIIHITEGPHAGFTAETGQWESMVTLQTRFGIDQPNWVLKGNAVCNQMGIGLDEAGGALSWAMECYQRGIITKEDTGGIELNWNDPDMTLELIKMISHREGIGDLLAEGCARASEILGRDSEYYALHHKKVDLYEPCRGAMGWCLGSTTSTRGGGHTTGAPLCETSDPSMDVEKARQVYGIDSPHIAEVYEGKAKMVLYGESLQRANNAFGICHYNTTYLDPHLVDLTEISELYSAVTGWETSVEDLKFLAMKQLNLEKAFNLRFTDFDRKDDMPTLRDQIEPIPSGGLKGWKMDMDKYNEMLDEYYDLHGWDRKTSYPKKQILIDLGLDYVVDELEQIGKLG